MKSAHHPMSPANAGFPKSRIPAYPRFSPWANLHFSPRAWKGGASAPPLQGPPDYSCVPCPAQSVSRRTARGTGPTEGGSRDSGGAEAPPFRQPIKSLAAGPWREREHFRKVRGGGRNKLAHGDNHGIRSPEQSLSARLGGRHPMCDLGIQVQ